MSIMASLEIRLPESWDMTEEQLRAWWGSIVDDLCSEVES